MFNNLIINKMDSIIFSTNWNNKLECKAFTTIRLHNPNKYKVAEHYEIILSKKPTPEIKGIAVIQQIKVIKMNQFNDFLSYLDTGYNTAEMTEIVKKMYKGKNFETQLFDFILLVYLKPQETCNQ